MEDMHFSYIWDFLWLWVNQRHHGCVHCYQSCNFVAGKKIQDIKKGARLWKWFPLAKIKKIKYTKK